MDSRIHKGTAKLYNDIINRLKNRQVLSHDNKLVGRELSALSNPLMKLLIEVETCNYSKFDQGRFQQLENKVEMQSKTVDKDSDLMDCYRLLILKMKVVTLIGLLAEGDINLITVCLGKLLNFIDSWKQYRYILKLMFQVNSLIQLEEFDINRIIENKLSDSDKEQLYYVIGLVKTQNRPQQARKIFESKLVNYRYQDVVIDKRNVIRIVRSLLEKQKDLLIKKQEGRHESEQSTISAHSLIKESLKEKFKQQYNIDLEQSQKSNRKFVDSLPQRQSLVAASLFRFYYEKHPEVIEGVSDTGLYNKMLSAEYQLPSTISATVSHLPLSTVSKGSKIKASNIKNFDLFKTYQSESNTLCSSKYMLIVREGLDVSKHNFGNSSSLPKWVKFNYEALYWGKTPQEIETSNTRHKIKQITGLLYGKCTARQQQNTQPSELMFSFILHDRTVDFTIKNAKDKERMFQFIMGAAWNIDSYHQRQRRLKQIDLKPNGKQDQKLNREIHYHKYKRQSMTKGKLLWKNLFTSLASKNIKTNKDAFPKAKNLYSCSPVASELEKSSHTAVQGKSCFK